MQRRFLLAAAGAASLLFAANAAWAQSYPNKPVRLVVPFAPGGTTDIVARVLAEKIGGPLGQQMIVENKRRRGWRARRDRHCASHAGRLCCSASRPSRPSPRTLPSIRRSPYNPLTDFTPIINVAATPNVIAVHPSFPGARLQGFPRRD